MNQHDLIRNIIQQLFSYLPLGGIASQLFSTPLANWLSPNSSMSNAFIWPGQDQSMSMAATNFMDSMRQQAFNSTAARLSHSQQLRALTEYHRMLNPSLSDNELRGLAENSAENMFDIGSALYSWMDPYKLNAGLPAASSLAGILHRRGSRFELSGADYAGQVARALMGDTKDSLVRMVIDDPSKFGNMSVADVMAVGKEIALTDKFGFSTSDGKFDASRFTQRVQEVTKALSPWKDIFGKDIPELLNQLEALTGQSIGSTGSAAIQSMGDRMMAILGTTGARIQHIAAYRDAIANNLIDPTMSSRSILGAAAIAGDMTLGMANYSVSHLTSRQSQELAGRIYSGTAASKFTDRYAMAYARWSASMSDAEADPEKFHNLVMTNIAKGMSNTQALLEASGASSLAELGAYKDTDRYLNMIKSGAANRANMDAIFSRAKSQMESFYTSDNFGSNYNATIAARLTAMSQSDFNRIMAMSSSEKRDWIASLGISGDTQQLVAAMERGAAMAYSSVTGLDTDEGKIRFIYGERNNYLKNEALAKDRESFNNAVRSIQTSGGLGVVLNNMKNHKGSISEMLKDFSGGSDMLKVLLEYEYKNGGFDVADVSTREIMYRQGINFARNNYSELGEGGVFNPIYKMMMDRSNPDNIKKGYRLAAELNSLGQGVLSKLSIEEQKNMLAYIQSKELSGDPKDIGNVIKDYHMDTQVRKTYDKLINKGELKDGDKDLTAEAKAIVKLMSEKSHSSKEALKKDVLELAGDNEDAKKRYEAAFNKITKGIGNIDGTDVLQTIAKALESLPKDIERFIQALSEAGSKPKR